MTRALFTVGLLLASNIFMTWAWYGHLKKSGWTIPVAIAISWLIALPEYILQVPANRIGHMAFGGPFSAPQLKILQEAITLTVFTVFAIVVLKEKIRPNDAVAMLLVLAAVVVSMLGRPATPDPTPLAADRAATPGHPQSDPPSPDTHRNPNTHQSPHPEPLMPPR